MYTYKPSNWITITALKILISCRACKFEKLPAQSKSYPPLACGRVLWIAVMVKLVETPPLPHQNGPKKLKDGEGWVNYYINSLELKTKNCFLFKFSLLFSLFVTQRSQMRWMSAKVILYYNNICASRSKIVKILIVALDDLWYIFHNIHI